MAKAKSEQSTLDSEQPGEVVADQQHFHPETGLVITAPSKEEADREHAKQVSK
jgi:hypothetical protein